MGELDGKVCVITGAAGRIGRALVDRFQASGATLIALDVTKQDLQDVDCQQCDLGDVKAIELFEAYVRQKYGSIHCLVNNGAVGGHLCPLGEKTVDEFDLIMSINVRGPLLLMQMAIRLQTSSSDSCLSMINITSVAGHRPTSHGSLYAASKAALISLTKSAAKEYGGKGIRCNSISPGIMEVPNVQGFGAESIREMHEQVPMKRGGRPQEIAEAAVWLAGSRSSYVNGADLLIDGGSLS